MKRIILFILVFFVCFSYGGCSNHNKPYDVLAGVSKELNKNYDGGKKVRIAVIDSGVDLSNIAEQYVINFCEEESAMDYMEHGNVVYNIIANREYGLAPNATVYSIKVINRYGNASTNAIVNALEWCLENSIDVINMSLSFGGYNESVECLVNELVKNGVVLVSSISNTTKERDYPSMYDGVICVGVTDTPEQYNQSYRIVLEKDSKVIVNSKDYSGNSFLAPTVTGIIACLINKKNEERRRTSDELVNAVKRFLLVSNISVM